MMSSDQPPSAEPRFFFLMPVWGEAYVDYLLTFALPTLLAPNNLPWLPNRAQSQFTFLTTEEDEARIRASRLFGVLDALVPIKFVHLTFYKGTRQEKFDQLGHALKLGSQEALGKGFCFFFHPDGLYSDGMLKFLYGVAKSGKKACVSHGPVVTQETVIPYLRERGLYRFDEVNPLPSRTIAQTLLDNLHPDMAIHCMENPHYPETPYMGFWLLPDNDGALFRFVSLHPWMVDLSELSEIADFSAIDHNFIRSHPFIWSDEVHVETDSDKFLVIGIKPRHEMNAQPSRKVNKSVEKCLAKSLFQSSNCNYSRLCFFHAMRVRIGGTPQSWRTFEAENLRELNVIASAHRVFRSTDGRLFGYSRLFFTYAVIDRDPAKAFREGNRVIRRTWLKGNKRIRHYARKFRYYVFERREFSKAIRYTFNVLGLSLKNTWSVSKAPGGGLPRCPACRSDARRCVSITDTVTR